jgi:hypothetical protein
MVQDVAPRSTADTTKAQPKVWAFVFVGLVRSSVGLVRSSSPVGPLRAASSGSCGQRSAGCRSAISVE